jgi:hypothetical protein
MIRLQIRLPDALRVAEGLKLQIITLALESLAMRRWYLNAGISFNFTGEVFQGVNFLIL